MTCIDGQILDGKRILLVDDEPAVRDAATGALRTSVIVTAVAFDKAKSLMRAALFDLVILDVMSVSTLFLLETCVKRRIPVAVLGTHAANKQILRASIKLGAVSIIPTDALHRLPEIVADIFENMERGDPRWTRLLDSVGPCFREEEAVE